MVEYPFIDPVVLSLGPLQIRWYGLAYVAGILGGYLYLKRVLTRFEPHYPLRPEHISEGLTWIIFGIVLGGRLGYVVFYDLSYYLHHPVQILNTLQGGMSFHGGLLGVIIATYAYTKKHALPLLGYFDCLALATPIGLGLGRLANFINGELYGTPTTLPWGVIFPEGGMIKRHPSQLYEALLEGALLFFVLFFFMKKGWLKTPGRISGVFMIGYGISRFLVECVRVPDATIGYFIGGTTWGQWLTLPMIFVGVALIIFSYKGQKKTS
jgi:phosphatidylglycerol:prolipoprotein diacylglycerol transferase